MDFRENPPGARYRFDCLSYFSDGSIESLRTDIRPDPQAMEYIEANSTENNCVTVYNVSTGDFEIWIWFLVLLPT